MTINVSKTTLHNTGSITFGSLRTNFKQTESGSISASELKRNTSLDTSNPIVPDCTENINISASNDWKTSQFRGSIKKYEITQSDINQNLSIQSLEWNSNLNKNIIKKLYITGTIGATSTSGPAAQINAQVCNLEIDVSGAIYGSGGATSSGNGGNALYVNNTLRPSPLVPPDSNLIPNSQKILINVNENGRIWSGGAAGTSGNTGNSNSIRCYNVAVNTNRGDGRSRSSCGAPNCELVSGHYLVSDSCNGDSNTSRRNCSNGRRRCYREWDRTCTYRRDITLTANGGNGGNFGVGRGYNNINTTSLSGNRGNTGNTVRCDPTGGSTTGRSGNDGNSGAEWGTRTTNASAGRAIYRDAGNTSNYFVVRGSTTNILGARNPVI